MTIKLLFSTAWKQSKENFSSIGVMAVGVYLLNDILVYIGKISIGGFIYGLLFFLVQFWVYQAHIIKKAGLPLSWRTILTHRNTDFNQKFRSGVWVLFISGLMIFGLFLLLIIPGVIYWVYWSLAYFVVFDKGLTGRKALNYSKKLVKGNWWKVFAINILYIISALVFGFIVILIATIFFGEGLITSAVSSIVVSLVTLYFCHVLLVLYLDLESKKTINLNSKKADNNEI